MIRRSAPFVLIVLVATCAGRASEYPSSAETRAEFAAVCQRFTSGDDPFFGTAAIDQLSAKIAESAGDPLVSILLRTRLATNLIRLGRQDEAIERLQEALKILEATAPPDALTIRRTLLFSLALAHYQIAERQNCVNHHAATSCILPIAPSAVHRLPEHSRRAGDLLQEIAAGMPDAPTIRWLLNLSRMLSGDYPRSVPAAERLPPDALTSPVPFPRWSDIAPELGVDTFDLAGGAAMEDFDGDGLLDLVTSSWDPCEPMHAFRNDGRGGFEDVSGAWGLDAELGGLNLIQTDYDNDGHVDLLVLRGAWQGEAGRVRNSLLRNDLAGPTHRFVDVTAAAGLAFPAYPTQTAAWADVDGDGDLDLYVGNEATATGAEPLQLFGKEGNPYPSQLFRNNGDGTFTDVTREAGIDNRRFAKSVVWGDYDNDGDPDLYISNIGPNRLYRNNGDGTFTDMAPELGVVEPAKGSFTSWWFDFDNDGDLDLLVSDYSTHARLIFESMLGGDVPTGHPVLYRNDGGRFTDVSVAMGLTKPALPMGANYGDLDNDGWLDFYLGTGIPNFDALMPNLMYRNDAGRRFVDVTFSGGFGHLQKGHGVAFGDLDGDGDQDLYEEMGGAFPYDKYGNVLYENPGNENRWIVLRLVGRKANRFGIGGRIAVRVLEGGAERTIYDLVGSGGSFGASSLQQEIGLGRASRIESITIDWPGSGTHQVFTDVEPDRYYRAVEGGRTLTPIEVHRFTLGAHAAPDAHPVSAAAPADGTPRSR